MYIAIPQAFTFVAHAMRTLQFLVISCKFPCMTKLNCVVCVSLHFFQSVSSRARDLSKCGKMAGDGERLHQSNMSLRASAVRTLLLSRDLARVF